MPHHIVHLHNAHSHIRRVHTMPQASAATIDFSQCLWHTSAQTLYCHMPRVLSLWPSGRDSAASGLAPITAVATEAGTSWLQDYLVQHVAFHRRLDFHFDEEGGREAQIYENVCLALTASPSPLALAFPYGVCTPRTAHALAHVATLVRDGGNASTWSYNIHATDLGGMLRFLQNVVAPTPVHVSDLRPRAGGTMCAQQRPLSCLGVAADEMLAALVLSAT